MGRVGEDVRVLFKLIIIAAIFCSGPIIIFLLAGKSLGMTKEQERDCINRSAQIMISILMILIILPSVVSLVSSFFNEVLRGSMSLSDYFKHLNGFSFHAANNFYANLFSKLTKF